MPHLKDPKHEKFAGLVAETNKITESFRKVFKPKGKPKTVNEAASRLASKVSARIEEIRKEYQEAADKARILTKTEAMVYLSDIVRTPVGEVDETSPLCQEYTEDTIGGGKQGKLKRGTAPEGNEQEGPPVIRTKIKMPGKIDAIKQLGAMQGWNAVEEVNVNVTSSQDVADALAQIFAKKR